MVSRRLRTTVANKRAAEAAIAKAKPLKAKKESQGLISGVHVSASLERKIGRHDTFKYPGWEDSSYEYQLKKLYIDKFGNLIGVGRCGDELYVCSQDEIPVLAEFLKKVGVAGIPKS